MHLRRLRLTRTTAQMLRKKTLRDIVPSVPSGWNRGAANWSAQYAAITCLARTITDMLRGTGPVAAGTAIDEEMRRWHSR